jgi:hypothetical protein
LKFRERTKGKTDNTIKKAAKAKKVPEKKMR